jgi:ribonuclease E
MVLESNRDLVVRRLVECLGRDRTKHQVAEVTSLGLVQMTRKRIGSGLIESFSETCEHCGGRGIRVSLHADHDHADASPKHRKPANAVDPADVAARALAAHETEEVSEVTPADDAEATPAAEVLDGTADEGIPEEAVADEAPATPEAEISEAEVEQTA